MENLCLFLNMQAFGVLPKVLCDVKHVEVLKGVRLTKSSVEQFTIRVPRTKLEYFQDDIYPSTLVYWESALTAKEWLDGKNKSQRTVSLKPPGMKPCKLIDSCTDNSLEHTVYSRKF